MTYRLALTVDLVSIIWHLNTLRPRQIGRHLADDIFKCILLNENGWIPIKISLKFVPKRRINNTPALVQIMAWRRSGDKALSEPMMVILPTHICVTRPKWVKTGKTSPKRSIQSNCAISRLWAQSWQGRNDLVILTTIGLRNKNIKWVWTHEAWISSQNGRQYGGAPSWGGPNGFPYLEVENIKWGQVERVSGLYSIFNRA